MSALSAQEGPGQQGSETVAKPRKKAGCASGTSRHRSRKSAENPFEADSEKQGRSGGDVNFKADTSLVTVDVAVLDNKGNPIPKIPQGNFRILEDNVPQTVTQYSVGQAPMTVALVVEFSNRYQSYWGQGWYETLQASYGFTQTLRPDDYIAIIAYDLRTEILADFTNDKAKISEAMSRLRIPGFSESNMFDALADTADRMSKIEGRKAIVLVTSGIDTFSKLTYDKTRKSLQESGVPVYSIGILQLARQMAEARGGEQDRLPAGRQRTAHLRERNRRPGVLPALHGGDAERLRADQPGDAQPVLVGLFAHQSGAATASSARSPFNWSIRPPTNH